ncbi:MAG: hypothetical protein Q9218_002129 [Villophora microphyllina]
MAQVVHFSGARGWLEDNWDGRDHPFTSATKKPAYPSSANLRDGASKQYWPSEIYNQGHLNSCVANATAAAYYFELKKELAAKKLDKELFAPSRLFIYWVARNARRGDKPITDSGTMTRNAMQSLWKQGLCKEDTWKYLEPQVNVDPGQAAYQEADKHHIVKYERLDIQRRPDEAAKMTPAEKDADGTHVLDNIRQSLQEGHPVVIGFRYYWEHPAWTKLQPENMMVLPALTTPRHSHPPKKPDGSSYGGHAVVAVGYDDKRKLVRCLNSWGDGFSVHGEFWMPYEWVTDFEATSDFWMLRLVHA